MMAKVKLNSILLLIWWTTQKKIRNTRWKWNSNGKNQIAPKKSTNVLLDGICFFINIFQTKQI